MQIRKVGDKFRSDAVTRYEPEDFTFDGARCTIEFGRDLGVQATCVTRASVRIEADMNPAHRPSNILAVQKIAQRWKICSSEIPCLLRTFGISAIIRHTFLKNGNNLIYDILFHG